MNKPKLWKIVLLLLLVFVAGGVAGSLVTGHFAKKALARAFDFSLWPEGMIHGLENEMTLTDGQKAALLAIGERLAGRMQTTLNSALAESGRAIVDAQREIDAVLDADQKVIHARMKADFRKGLKEGLGVTLPEE